MVQEILEAIQGNLKPLQEYLHYPLHSAKVLRLSAERFVHLYLERFIYYIKLVYSRDNVLQKFQPVLYRPVVVTMKMRSPERKRLENRLEVLKCLTRDYNQLEAFVRENDQSLSSTFASELLVKMEIIVNLMRLDSCDFVTGCAQYRKQIYIKQIIEAVVCIRSDINRAALSLIFATVDQPDDNEDD